MRNIWKIYKNDIHSVVTNWVFIIIIGGLTLLPSFYAWFNIKASWDPYGQTNQIPVAVVNEDKGATVRDTDIHVGNDLVAALKNNDAMGWEFVNRDDAMAGVEYGDFFAVIIIPQDFSKDLGTVITDEPQKAVIEYYVNEKINAIAPKITQKGASLIVEQLSSDFIATVNGVIFKIFNEVGLELEKDLPDIKRFEEYVFTIEEHLPEIYDLLNESLTDANSAEELINKASGLTSDAKQVTSDGLSTVEKVISFINEAEEKLKSLKPQLEEDVEKAEKIVNQVNEYIQALDSTDIELNEKTETKKEIDQQIDEAITTLQEMDELLKQIDSDQPTINDFKQEITHLQNSLQAIQSSSNEWDNILAQKQSDISTVLKELKQEAELTTQNIEQFVQTYNEKVEPTITKEVQQVKDTLKSAKDILVEIEDSLPEVDKLLANTDEHIGEGKEVLETVLGEYPYINNKVNELANRIRELQAEMDINEIILLLQNDPEAERSFFAEPVLLKEHQLFPIENYGTGMTPFYTVLAIWVGGLLLISILATDVKTMGNMSIRDVYFGRLLTFLTIGLCQTLIVTSGDILLLGVKASHSLWFIIFGLFISVIFMLTIYTIVSVFGDVGKALAIILLVLQIASSGGTYPVVLLPEFFQFIHPLLPFTYAVDLLREAVGGIVWKRVGFDLICLTVFGIIAISVGLFLKEPINKQMKKLLEGSNDSELFH